MHNVSEMMNEGECIMNDHSRLKEYFYIVFGTALTAVAVYFFMLPINLCVGSITALANILTNLVPLKVSTLTLICNLILLVVGLLLIGPDFAAKTAFGSVLLPIMLAILEFLFPNQGSVTDNLILDVVCYVLIVSMGQALLFTYNASTGGLEIVAKLMNKYLRIDLGKAFSVVGITVALSSAIYYDKTIVVISLLGTYFGGFVLDKFVYGLNIKRRICIISKHSQEILDYILNTLHSDASLYDVLGARDTAQRTEINIIVDNQQYRALRGFLKQIDPDAFITIYEVNEVLHKKRKDSAR